MSKCRRRLALAPQVPGDPNGDLVEGDPLGVDDLRFLLVPLPLRGHASTRVPLRRRG